MELVSVPKLTLQLNSSHLGILRALKGKFTIKQKSVVKFSEFKKPTNIHIIKGTISMTHCDNGLPAHHGVDSFHEFRMNVKEQNRC